MTTQNLNPLGIDFAEITHAAERRTSVLKALGTIISTKVADAFAGLDVIRSMYGELHRFYVTLDNEGKDRLPAEVKAVLSGLGRDMAALDGVLGNADKNNRSYGIIDLMPYAAVQPKPVPSQTVEGTEYTIKVAFQYLKMSPVEMAEALNAMYDYNNIAGTFKVEPFEERGRLSWRWITFTRVLADDAPHIQERMARSNFTRDAQGCAVDQLAAELEVPAMGADQGSLIEAICKALTQAEVRFPAP